METVVMLHIIIKFSEVNFMWQVIRKVSGTVICIWNGDDQMIKRQLLSHSALKAPVISTKDNKQQSPNFGPR